MVDLFYQERVDNDGSLMKTSVHALRVEVPILSGDASSGLTAGQAYNIHLEIDMPESEVNHNAGTFMITALYYDRVSNLDFPNALHFPHVYAVI